MTFPIPVWLGLSIGIAIPVAFFILGVQAQTDLFGETRPVWINSHDGSGELGLDVILPPKGHREIVEASFA